jgi:HD-GYP domain-containing protein (c-di-GMP phosphodiesterase class II)
MHTRDSHLRFPLHITIGTLFIALIVVFSAVLTWQNYSKTSAIMLSGAAKVYKQATREMFLDFRGTYHSVAETIKLMALSPLINAGTLEERVKSVEMVATALRGEPSLSAIQLGYPNGDYFIVRPLSSPGLRQTFSAPDSAHYVADHVNSDTSGGRQLTRLFFDAQLQEISSEAAVASGYDPRTRPWYRNAGEQVQAIKPYLFYFIGKVGTTITLKTSVPGVVIAADITLEQLSETIRQHQITPDSEVVLMEADGRALAYRHAGELVTQTDARNFRIAQLSELGSAVLTSLSQDLTIEPQQLEFSFAGRRWTGSINSMSGDSGLDLYMLMISPLDELLSDAIAIRWLSVMTTLFIVLITIPIVWYVASRISGPMQQLAAETGLISRFDFSSPVETRSFIKEVDALAGSIAMMKNTINRFLTLINSLAGEKDFDSLLERITRETMQVSQADGVLTYLVDEDEKHLEPCALYEHTKGDCSVDKLPRLSIADGNKLADFLHNKEPSLIHLDSGDTGAFQPLLRQLETNALTLVALPLHNRQNEAIGTLCLLYRDSGNSLDSGEHQQQIAFIQALSGFAAVTLESRQLLMMQEALLNAFIKLIAGAIDAKSPYTGGHCQRVPELTRMLAKAACDSDDPPFRDFKLDDEQWEALDIASWLHDCGKVTTPEYVVDKATKLDTIYDRIHEVRMRFEVLKRDAEIRYLEQLAGAEDRAALRKTLEDEWRQLDDDFAFIAACNEGGEFMAAEKVERLQKIAGRSWTRTLDDRIGISWEEKQRKDRTPPSPLPAAEKLLDDKPEHLIERSEAERMPVDNPWGFKLDVPEYKFNRGEIYNLTVSRGTLTAEERFKINDHMVQTIIMLEKLPYPKHLRDVPMIAGCHHETMTGTGYPKRLTREQMPLTARMMAIADIFEALTAADRPYKKAKTLSEAVHILSFMKKDEHIDAELFDLFLRSGIWLSYGRRFLQAEQIDEVDIFRYLGKP